MKSKKNLKRILAYLLTAILLIGLMPQSALAADLTPTEAESTVTIDLSTVNADDDTTGKGYTCSEISVNNETEYVVTITGSAIYVLTGTVSQEINPTRIIVSAETADITLDDVSIAIVNASPLSIDTGSTINLTLAEGTTNTLSAGDSQLGFAGLYVPEGATVNIGGSGTLNAVGGGSTGFGVGAGIGGMSYENAIRNAGTITINGGTINATGRLGAAGIGGAESGDGGNITINGGTTNATSETEGAGIGGGYSGSGGNIVISGGTINATGGAGEGIGVGRDGTGGSILIKGGSVKASNISPAPTDGTGPVYLVALTVADLSGTAIENTDISCTMPSGVQFEAGTDSAGKLYLWLLVGKNQTATVTCGGVDYQATGHVTSIGLNSWITGPTVNNVIVTPASATVAKGESYPFSAAVTGTNSPDQTVTWSVIGGVNGTSISSNGELTVAANETAETPTVKATPTVDGSKYATVTVTVVAAGTVVPVSIDLSTVNKNGKGYTCSEITVNNETEYVVTITESGTYILTGTVNQEEHPTHVVVSAETADVVLDGVGITLVNFSPFSINPDSTVNLTLAKGTTNTLNFDDSQLGFAGLHVPEGATVNIGGSGTLNAVGGGSTGFGVGAGIGGMSYENAIRNAGTITINGGTINATGRLGAAGIGGAESGDGGNITINGGTINAVSENGGAGIGEGYSGTGGSILIKGGSVKASSIFPEPTDGTESVYLTDVTVADLSEQVFVNTDISCTMPGGFQFDARTDSVGKLYLWLPVGENIKVKVICKGEVYDAIGNITSIGPNSILTKPAVISVIVTGVTVTPATATVTKGYTKSFEATVTGINSPAQTVIWSVTGGRVGTGIDNNGLLTVAANESASTLTITATSTADSSKYGTASIIVVNSNNSSSGGGGGSSTGTTDETVPKLEGSDLKGWEAIEKKLEESIKENAQNGSNVVINLNGITLIPKELFETIRGQNVTVTLVQANGIEWLIHGQDIGLEAELGDIDLKVILREVKLSQEQADNLIGAGATVTLSIAHEGDFGFSATLRLNLEKANQGLTANLYYINPVTNKLELQTAGRIGTDGYVSLDFVHASDYVIVIDKGETLAKLAEQSTGTLAKKTLYLGGTTGNSVMVKAKLPTQLETAIADGTCSYSVTYKSSNTKVASVSSAGKIKAGKVGKATITTTMDINGIKASFSTEITVKKAYIKLVKYKNTMKIGTSYTYQAKGYGVEISDIIWSTTQKSIVAINKTTGKATAKIAGIDYIVATAGKIKVKTKVTIK